MTDVVELVIPGKPTPKGRPRSTRTGRHYTPAETVQAERRIRDIWLITTAQARAPHLGPVSLEIEAVFVPPQSWPKWKREAALAGEYPHLARPDLDNLIKLCKDSLNGAAWHDDSQVTNVLGSKYYGEDPQTIVRVIFHKEPERNMKGTRAK